jgi:hypothetical protein
VARRRLDRKAHGLEATDELADVFPHLGPLMRAGNQHAKPVLHLNSRRDRLDREDCRACSVAGDGAAERRGRLREWECHRNVD